MAHGSSSIRRGSGINTTTITFRFYPNGTSNAALSFDGKGVSSVVRNGSAGEFLITLTNAYYKLVGMKADIQLASVADLHPQFATVSNLATSTPTTILLRLLTATTPTDVSAGANNSVGVELVFEDSQA